MNSEDDYTLWSNPKLERRIDQLILGPPNETKQEFERRLELIDLYKYELKIRHQKDPR